MTTLLLTILLLAVVSVAALAIVTFNSLVQVGHSVDQAWSNIDVLLKQRHDELPKLIDTVRSYMRYESELLERITTLRL